MTIHDVGQFSVKFARRYIDLGSSSIFHSAGPDQCQFLEVYERHVLPELRRK
jgi:hypothetical protein